MMNEHQGGRRGKMAGNTFTGAQLICNMDDKPLPDDQALTGFQLQMRLLSFLL